jgi:hypothetical protein
MNLEDLTDGQTSTRKLRNTLKTRGDIKNTVRNLSKKHNPNSGIKPASKQDIDQGIEGDIPGDEAFDVEDA